MITILTSRDKNCECHAFVFGNKNKAKPYLVEKCLTIVCCFYATTNYLFSRNKKLTSQNMQST